MLFDKNGFYMIDSSKKNYDFAIDIMNGTFDNLSMWNIDDALKKGTLFPKLYKPYKNYEPGELKPSNDRERCLLEIQKLDFAINELNLYLDIYPDDTSAYRLFVKYTEDCKKKKDEYKRIYGPLMLDDLTDEYEWPNSAWPWERKSL